jgi:uncharacterized protein YebE (UPF0316 family)
VDLLLSAASIFLLRIADVSIGTLRIGFLVRGRSGLAGGLSFLESLVWLAAAAQVLTNLDSPVKFVAYAGGYATGTMLGVYIERWIAVGDVMMRIVAPVDSPSAAGALREAGYIVTEMNATGRDGEVRVSFSVLPRRRVAEALKLVRTANPQAFVAFEGTTPVRLTAFPAARARK